MQQEAWNSFLADHASRSSSFSLNHKCMAGVLYSIMRVLRNKLEQETSYSGFCQLLQQGRMPFRVATSGSDKCDYCTQWGMAEEPLGAKVGGPAQG